MKCSEEDCDGILSPVSLVKHGLYKCTKCGKVISKFKEEKYNDARK